MGSKIYQKDIASWQKAQLREFLFEFVRVPHVYGEAMLKGINTGKDLMGLNHIDMKTLGLPWGLASHVHDSIEQLKLSRDGIFSPVFVNARPYMWPFNGNLTIDNTALIIIDMQKVTFLQGC